MIYAEKVSQDRYNLFNKASNEKANQPMTDANSQSASTGFNRKRRLNEMSCDSPQSDKMQNNDDEEDKDKDLVENEKAESCTNYLFDVLNSPE